MTSNVAIAVDLFKSKFPGKVATPDSAEYEAAKTHPWSQTCWTPAAAYIQPGSAEEVAQSLQIIQQDKCRFAVRTTGHNPNLGFSSADETGVVLDLCRLKSKELVRGNVARVGAGNTWREVYSWLEDHQLSAVGGRDQQVGLPGFILGGGLGAFPNLHGVGADNVKNFEIALADGTAVNANSSENSDLYKALKGGGSNFGIITSVDLETQPLLKVQYTINVYNPEDYTGIINATVKVQNSMESDPKIGLFTNFNPGFVAVGLLYADQPTEQVKAFEPFYKLGSLLSNAIPQTNGTLLSLAQAMGHKQEPKNRAIGTVTTTVSESLYVEVYNTWNETIKDLPAGAVLHYTIQPVGKACIQAGKAKGGNVMGLEETPQCWWVFTCEWPKSGECEDAAAQKAVDSIVHKVESMAQEKGLLLNFLLPNFAGASQKVLRSYGDGSVQLMKELAAKYDPESVFQNLQHGGFLLRNSV
ncbi:hypothetical protein CDV36_000989 [Fusarium kuroshium]|uniref:FAD-binding PCMH-type domain-containing protein n=1 Tax=Fusarium kuroshium TaxID=2010991 RepID=A0A3M2SP77_9HYPO|nr:hypothetical protein CDV36_000989 [Fusarium kuroshium]